MKNASTGLASLELIDRLLNQLNDHKIPINLHIDLSKAFDKIRHGILLDKLINLLWSNECIFTITCIEKLSH